MTFARKNFIACFISVCMLFISLTTTTVSAENSDITSIYFYTISNEIIETYAGNTVNKVRWFENGGTSHIYTVNFSTSNKLNLKLMLTAGYIDGSNGNFDVYLDGIYKGTISINGNAQSMSMGSVSAGTHELRLWPNEYNKTYIIVGQVYYLT